MSARPGGSADPTGEVTELLQHLIRNACVNDGTPASGQEARNADVLASYLEGTGLDLERYEPAPGRANVVARIEGSEPSAPRLMLMGHTDVVPVTPDGWRNDPFGGELIDGEVWGRGAVDMLNETASMAVAFKRLARSGFRPKGTLTYLGVADEEALGTFGAAWLLEHQPDAVRTDYVITEAGGFSMPLPSTTPGAKLPVMVGEKGAFWAHIRVKGTPGHGSMPLRTDNALVKAAQVVQRLAGFQAVTHIDDIWRRFVQRAALPDALSETLLDAASLDDFVASGSTDVGLARLIHACTHTTIAPTIAHGGVKTNVIPDRVDLQVDVRTLPGETDDGIRSMLLEAIGPDLAPDVEIVADAANPASASPTETPLWDSLARVSEALVPGATTVPFLLVGATDARFFRWAGVTAYGYGLFSDRISLADFGSMFHGDDERIDQESLRLSEALWEGVAHDLLA
jgi:acetylornithine deacetylase/succinyl-diaminopimelate desuccinylase-like protein